MKERIDIESEILRLSRKKENSDSLSMITYLQGEIDALLWVLEEGSK